MLLPMLHIRSISHPGIIYLGGIGVTYPYQPLNLLEQGQELVQEQEQHLRDRYRKLA